MQNFLTDVANGSDYSGREVILMQDIDLGNFKYEYYWDTKRLYYYGGNEKSTFNGIFDGNNHTIKWGRTQCTYRSITYDLSAYESQALFAITGKDAIVKNLSMSISGSESVEYLSPAVSYDNFGTIKDSKVVVEAYINNTKTEFSGYTGSNHGLIDNCTIDINAKLCEAYGICQWNQVPEGYTPGILDVPTIKNCTINSNIQCYMFAGICGSNNGIIEYCKSFGNVTLYVDNWSWDRAHGSGIATDNKKEGIIRKSENHTNLLCDNTLGDPYSRHFSLGGVAFYNSGVINDCSNYGTISSRWQRELNSYDYHRHYNIEDIVHNGSICQISSGFTSYNYGDISNCYNYGNVISDGVYISGFCCYNTGQIKGCGNSGTIEYYSPFDNFSINNSYHSLGICDGICTYLSQKCIYNTGTINSIKSEGLIKVKQGTNHKVI